MPSITDGAIGIDLNTVGSARNHSLGETHWGSGGSEWLYVLAPAALAKGEMVGVEADGTATVGIWAKGNTASSYPGLRYAFAQTAFPASTYGFVATRGNSIFVRVHGPVGDKGRPLYTSISVQGCLSTASV